jgi:hypothetical protein
MKRVFLSVFYQRFSIFHVVKVLAVVLSGRGLLYHVHLKFLTVKVLALNSIYIVQDFGVVIKFTTLRTFEILSF